jgi:hypothetical protein
MDVVLLSFTDADVPAIAIADVVGFANKQGAAALAILKLIFCIEFLQLSIIF